MGQVAVFVNQVWDITLVLLSDNGLDVLLITAGVGLPKMTRAGLCLYTSSVMLCTSGA